MKTNKVHMKIPSAKYLKTCFSYDAETGKLYWRNRPPEHFKKLWAHTLWNSRFAGLEAGSKCKPSNNWYLYCGLDGKNYRLHRLIYFMLHPDANLLLQIDHINGDSLDNRRENLRLVTNQDNHKNLAMRSNNKSGVMGVGLNKATGKWEVCIHVNGKKKFLGLFTDLKEAARVRKQAEVKYGFHPNHGRV
jgi:hypothetical protein